MRRLWRGEKVGAAQLDPWPAAVGGPKLLIGSWAGSRWIPRAAKDFDGWIGSGAGSSVAALRDGIKRFREAGGQRAIATNIPVDLEAPTAPMPEEGQFHLRCDPTTAAQRLRMLPDLGFDDAVLVTRRYGDADLAALRALWPSRAEALSVTSLATCLSVFLTSLRTSATLRSKLRATAAQPCPALRAARTLSSACWRVTLSRFMSCCESASAAVISP